MKPQAATFSNLSFTTISRNEGHGAIFPSVPKRETSNIEQVLGNMPHVAFPTFVQHGDPQLSRHPGLKIQLGESCPARHPTLGRSLQIESERRTGCGNVDALVHLIARTICCALHKVLASMITVGLNKFGTLFPPSVSPRTAARAYAGSGPLVPPDYNGSGPWSAIAPEHGRCCMTSSWRQLATRRVDCQDKWI